MLHTLDLVFLTNFNNSRRFILTFDYGLMGLWSINIFGKNYISFKDPRAQKFLGFVIKQGLILHTSLGINSDTGCTEEYKE